VDSVRDALRVYLQDHHAAAAAGVALGRRTLGSSHAIAQQIEQDRRTLEHVMRCVDARPSRFKVALARIGDQVGRVKADRAVASTPMLGRLTALETLVVGVRGKQALWTALEQLGDPRLASFDFGALASTAGDQAAALDRTRMRVAAEALAERPEPSGAAV
jgi:hypothetical protein